MAIIVLWGLNLSPAANAAFGDWKAKIAEKAAAAAAAAQEKCEAAVTVATAAAAKTLDSAVEGAAALRDGFLAFLDMINFEGVGDGVLGGAAGIKKLLWDNFSFWEAGQMIYRIVRFNPDVEGLRTGMFGPMTEYIDRLRVTLEECKTLEAKQAAEVKVMIYGDFIKLLFEMSFKSYKMVPQVVVELVPSALGTVLAIAKPKNPESIDQFVVYVVRQFLVNAFKAVTTRGLSLEDRMALFSDRMAVIEASGQFAKDTGITDFLEALKRFRHGVQPPALPPALPPPVSE